VILPVVTMQWLGASNHQGSGHLGILSTVGPCLTPLPSDLP
jgi:hypothetical protein